MFLDFLCGPSIPTKRIFTNPMVEDGLLHENDLLLAVDFNSVVWLKETVRVDGALIHPVDGFQDFLLITDFPFSQFSFEETPTLGATSRFQFVLNPAKRKKDES